MDVSRQGLLISSPWMNAAGCLGFQAPHEWVWPHPPGVFVTNPVSLHPRRPAATRSAISFEGGVLMHTGLSNPGLRAVIKKFAVRWQRSDVPVWVHLLAETPDEVKMMVNMLELVGDGVSAVELGVPSFLNEKSALKLVEAALGEIPLVVQIALTETHNGWLGQLKKMGVEALSLGAPRGSLPGRGGGLVSGRLYGPAIYPLAVAALQSALELQLPVLAGGGVYSVEEGKALLRAGAAAVLLDTVLWG